MNSKKIISIVLIVLLCGTIVKDFIVKNIITSVGSKIVGAKIEMGGFSLGLLTQKVRMTRLKLYNPPGFPNEPMVDLPEVRVDFDTIAFLQGKLHARLVVFNMKEMVVVRNKEGKLNVDSLKIIEDQKAAVEAKKKEKTSEPEKQMGLSIDVLKLNVERVILKDYTKGEPPAISAFEVALKDKEFKDITSAQQMITLVMFQAMAPTAIQSAAMYAAATVLGVGFLPAGIVGMIVAKDDSAVEFKHSFDKVYSAALKFLQEQGEIKSEDKASGMIKAKVKGADITAKIDKQPNGKVKLDITARQMMLPKPEIAGGILYQIQGKLK